MIRPMTAGDVDAVVDLHLAAFPTFFLSFLGPRVLRLIYRGILREPDAIAVVAVDPAGTLSGFVTGVLEQEGFYRRLLQHDRWRFAVAVSGAALRKPSIVPRLLRALRRPAEARQSSAPALLISIAVRPEARGERIGRKLVAAFNDAIRARGVQRYCLTTDRLGNDATNAFYRAVGFELARTYVTPEGREMNEYLMRLP